MNRNLEVPIQIFKLEPCIYELYTILRKNKNAIFEAVKIKLKQLYVLFIHLINLIVHYLYKNMVYQFRPKVRATLRWKPDNNFSFCYVSVHKTFIDCFIVTINA